MATITDYTDLISVSEAKLYLRIDSDITESDSEIYLMIGSACNLIENYTQVYLKPQSKQYFFNTEGTARVYAYPINSVTAPVSADDYDVTEYQLYKTYCPLDAELTSMTFNIGHNDTDNVKPIFKSAILETIKLWFYGSEDEAVLKGGYIPNSVMAILSSERRFIF